MEEQQKLTCIRERTMQTMQTKRHKMHST